VALQARQDEVARFIDDPLARAAVRRGLADVGDVERLANRAVAGIATPRDLANLRGSLVATEAVAAALPETASPALVSALPGCAEVHTLLAAAIADEPPPHLGKGTSIRPGFAPELDGHEGRARQAREWIANLERSERDRTGIRSLKVGYNRVFGYYLEVTAAALAAAERERGGPALPPDYLPKQSLANATRYFTPQLKEYETVVLTAEETLAGIEADVFKRVVAQVAGAATALLAAAAAVAEATSTPPWPKWPRSAATSVRSSTRAASSRSSRAATRRWRRCCPPRSTCRTTPTSTATAPRSRS
jgi:DNA mismatch repair protein MutS